MSACLSKLTRRSLFAVALLPVSARAGLMDVCVPVGSSSVQVAFPGPITVQRDAPAGTVLATREVPTAMECANLYYPTGSKAVYFKWGSNPSIQSFSAPGYSVYPTGVAGVGLYWGTRNHESVTYNMSVGSLNDESSLLEVPFPYLLGSRTYPFTQVFKLIKTGPVSGGTFSFPSFKVMTRPVSLQGDFYKKDLFTFSFSPVQVVGSSCELKNSGKTVDLGQVEASGFKGPGTTLGARAFALELKCTPGARMNLTLDKTLQNTSYVGTINLVSTSSASGVGIQVLDAANGQPIPLGQAHAMGVAASGDTLLALVARYIQTGQRVVPGKAQAILSFTLSYN